MKFSGVVLRIQLQTPKIAIIRAGATLAEAESDGLQAGPNPSRALRVEVCQKLADAIRAGKSSIDLNVSNGVIVESSPSLSASMASSPSLSSSDGGSDRSASRQPSDDPLVNAPSSKKSRRKRTSKKSSNRQPKGRKG